MKMIETPCVAEGNLGLQDAKRLALTADFVVPDRIDWSSADTAAHDLEAFASVLPQLGTGG